jgi:hypothetical protein
MPIKVKSKTPSVRRKSAAFAADRFLRVFG